jgi:hypothetical protein
MTNKPFCIDIYQGDDVIDYPGKPLGGFALVKAQGIAFLDHKASQGTGMVDSRVAARYAAWMDGNPIAVTDVDGTQLSLKPRFGFYHFNGGSTAPAEAAHFLSVVKPLFNKGDDLCLDWEDLGASGTQMSAQWADDFCNAVEDWCQFPIKIYGGDAPREQMARASSTVLSNMSTRRMWFCQYGTFQPSLVPVPWKNSSQGVFQWQDDGDQYGPGPHTIPGIANYCDNSTVVGGMTAAKIYALWGGGTPSEGVA